jgi:methionyl-tRNA formyltransferase
MKKSKIIFMGTPEFAVPALRLLHETDHDVALVVTMPDRPKGRGRKMVYPPVKVEAAEFGYNVIQPVSVKTKEFYDQIAALNPDFLVVAAFGHILPEKILCLPKIGAVNIHPSLLPKHRGPAPVQWAVINQDTETGVTTMLMDKGTDTGKILMSERVMIFPEQTAENLHDHLAELGASILIKTLDGLETNSIEPKEQNHAQATYAPLLKKKDGRIDWNQTAEKIEAFIRGMTPWPGAFTFYNRKRYKIFSANIVQTQVQSPPGTVIDGFPDELRIQASRNAILISGIQTESGKRMCVKDFLRGARIPSGSVFK